MAFLGRFCFGRFSRLHGRHPRRDSRHRSKRARRADEEGVALGSILRPRHGDDAPPTADVDVGATPLGDAGMRKISTSTDVYALDVGLADAGTPFHPTSTASAEPVQVVIVHPVERRAYHHRGGDRDGDGGDGRAYAFAAFAAGPDVTHAPRVKVLSRLTAARVTAAARRTPARQVHPDDRQRDVGVPVPSPPRSRPGDATARRVPPRRATRRRSIGRRRTTRWRSGPTIARLDRCTCGPRGEAVETPAGNRAGRTRVPDPVGIDVGVVQSVPVVSRVRPGAPSGASGACVG